MSCIAQICLRDNTCAPFPGRFLFIETSWPRLPKETARVESEVIMGSSTGTCLRFWYHMQGAHIGTLNVYLKIIGISTSILWSLNDAQGSSWLQGQIPVKSGRRNFQVCFLIVTIEICMRHLFCVSPIFVQNLLVV